MESSPRPTLGHSALSEGPANAEARVTRRSASCPYPPGHNHLGIKRTLPCPPGVPQGGGPFGGPVSPSASAEETKVKSPLVGVYAGGGPGGCISRPLRARGGGGGCGWAQALRRPRRRPAPAPYGGTRQPGDAGWEQGPRRTQLATELSPKVPTEAPSVATAQEPRRRRPDRTITVTAPL